MDTPQDTPLTSEDRNVIEAYQCHFAPPTRTAAQRSAMRNALHERLDRRWWAAWPPIAAAACAAALAVWFVLPAGRVGAPPSTSPASGEVLVGYALDGDAAADLDGVLPQDYATIEDIIDL